MSSSPVNNLAGREQDRSAEAADLLRTRRDFLTTLASGGLGMLALGTLLDADGALADGISDFGFRISDLDPDSPSNPKSEIGNPKSRFPHFAPKAERCIFLFMDGAPSQLDLFDPKPSLRKYTGQ